MSPLDNFLVRLTSRELEPVSDFGVCFRGLLKAIDAQVRSVGHPGDDFLTLEFAAWVPDRDTGVPTMIRLTQRIHREEALDPRYMKTTIRVAFKDLLFHELEESLGFDGEFQDPHEHEGDLL